MLTRLYIRNDALITELDISWGSGLTIITGETGAGKSILLGALALLMGERADSKFITEGENRCIIEAEYTIDERFKQWFENNELDFDNYTIIRRELQANGKSRAFINDTPVSLSLLKQLSDKLIDIHSQHSNLLLRTGNFQLAVVDAVAHNQELQQQYKDTYNSYRQQQQTLADLKATLQQLTEENDYISFQFNQLTQAQLTAGEENELEKELSALSHAEEIKSALMAVVQAMSDEQTGAVMALKAAKQSLRHITQYLPDSDLLTRIDSSLIEIQDIASEAERMEADTQFNPQRLTQVSERLDLLNSLMQKHRCHTTEELIALRDRLDGKLNQTQQTEELIRQTEQQLALVLAELKQKAQKLAESREAVLNRIDEHLRLSLIRLGMPNANVRFTLLATDDFTADGTQQAELLFAANKNQSLRPVCQVASGGEIARLMLCLKALTSEQQRQGTIIFDEIDTGVSGEVAQQMGIMIKQMAQSSQIITITHLPQIAAKADAHYKVYKADSDTRTETHIVRLNEEERIREIATLLSGNAPSEAALNNAKELLCNP